MTKLLPMLKPYRVSIAVALFLMFVELMVELFQPFLMAKMIDDGIVQKDLSVVLSWGAVLIAFSLIAFAAGIINSFYAAHVSQSFGFDLRERLFERTQSAPFSLFNRFPASSLITRITNDVQQLQNVSFMILRIMLRAPLLVVGGVVMAFVVNVKLAFVFAIAVPLLLLFLFRVMGLAATRFRLVQEKLDRVNGVMQENLVGMRLIKVFLRRQHEMNRFFQTNDELKERTVSALRTTETAMPVIMFVMNMCVIVVLWFGNLQLQLQGATVGDVVAVVNYSFRITMSLSLVSMIIMTLSRARASANRIVEVLDACTDSGQGEKTSVRIARRTGSLDGDIKFDAVSFRYPDTRMTVLKDISFNIKDGETVAVIGATGSGKSTLLQLIPRLYDPDQGAIYISGYNIRDLEERFLRDHIGYVPQEVHLFSGTIRDNIVWGKEEATEEQIMEAARDAQIDALIRKLPNGYETVLGQKGVNLSGGQKQRLSIARALLRRPKILLLDDCTSALDATTEARLLQALKKYQCTTLMITQKMSAMMNADRILILDHGRLAAFGTHAELLESSELYQKIWHSQMESEERRHA